MYAVIVIDCRTRDMSTFVASATKAQENNKVVLRHALEIGKLADIMSVKNFDLPIILMGNYSARSSCGYVDFFSNDEHRKVFIVGGLGLHFGGKGLRVLSRPIPGVIIPGPVVVEKVMGAGNSNHASAMAARYGAAILAKVDQKSAFLIEGQSDYTSVVRFKSLAKEGGAPVQFEPEHREEMFSEENIFRRMLKSAAYHDVIGHRGEGHKPSDEEVLSASKKKLAEYLSVCGRDGSWSYLGSNFEFFLPRKEAIEKVASELGEEVPPTPECLRATSDEFEGEVSPPTAPTKRIPKKRD